MCQQIEAQLNQTAANATISCRMSEIGAAPAQTEGPGQQPGGGNQGRGEPSAPQGTSHTSYACNCTESSGGRGAGRNPDGTPAPPGWDGGRFVVAPLPFPGAPGFGGSPGWSYEACVAQAQLAFQQALWSYCFGPGSNLRTNLEFRTPIWNQTPEQAAEMARDQLEQCSAQAERERDQALAYCQNRYQ
ncbi:MAG: hypothetical protein R3F55_02920 [Alphaproteobacteria bacterium]